MMQKAPEHNKNSVDFNVYASVVKIKIVTELTDWLRIISLSAPASIYLPMASDYKSRLQLPGREITSLHQDKLYSGFSILKLDKSPKLDGKQALHTEWIDTGVKCCYASPLSVDNKPLGFDIACRQVK